MDKKNSPAEEMKSGYAPVNGITMYYEIHGRGKPVVLIHGGGSTLFTTFGNMLPLLAQNRQVIAVELQAHGRTSDRDAQESFMQDADDVAALLNFLKIPKADLFGFSNGGNTAMQVAIRHPHLVRKLVIASAFYKRDGMIDGFFEGLAHATFKDMPAFLKEDFLKVNPDANKLQTMFDKDRQRMVSFEDWNESDLASIQAPALIMMADHDVVKTVHGVEMAEKIRGSELLIVPGTHGSYIGEASDEKRGGKVLPLTIAVIEDFLDK